MKSAKNYYTELSKNPRSDTEKWLIIDAIRQAQIDAVIETTQSIADNVSADYTIIELPDRTGISIETFVVKSTIFEVGAKIQEEIEKEEKKDYHNF